MSKAEPLDYAAPEEPLISCGCWIAVVVGFLVLLAMPFVLLFVFALLNGPRAP